VAQSKKGRGPEGRRPSPAALARTGDAATAIRPVREAAPIPSTAESAQPPAAPASLYERAQVAALPALALAAILLLPFAGKAFTIDDTVFLRQAEYALTDPLHPSALTMVWSEVSKPMRLSQVMPTGPLMAWLLMPVALASGSEIVAHLEQLLLVLLAVFEVAVLALRLGYDDEVARVAALFLAATPAVLGMSGTVMPDIAAMTLALVGVERLHAWGREGRAMQGVAAALALGIAPLARSHVLLLAGLGVLFLPLPPIAPFTRLLPHRVRAGAWVKWLPVVAAPVLMLLVLRIVQDPLGGSSDMVSAAGMFSSLGNVRSNAIAFGVHWVLLLPLGLAWMLSRGRTFWMSVFPWLGLAAALAAIWYGHETGWLWIAPVAGFGAAVVADVVADSVRRRDPTSGMLALWLLVALPIVIYLHFPSKYLVACAPAAAIVSARAVLSLPRPRAHAIAGGLIAAGAILGVMILRADSTFAGLGRRAAEELVAPYVTSGQNVWFNGHWGFQWYAEKAGGRCLTSTPPHPVHGDLVVSSVETITGIPIQSFRSRELVATVTDQSPGGRIVSSQLGAGFYSNGWGYLPWAWGSTPVDRFDLWRLR